MTKQKQTQKNSVIKKQLIVDWTLVNVIIKHAEENYQEFLEDYEQEELEYLKRHHLVK